LIGTLRTILAIMVALSHLPNTGMTINTGVIAVVFFYFLSGTLMAVSYEKFRAYDHYPALTFWVDRVLRLWPAFAAALFTTVLVVRLGGVHIVSWPVPTVTGHNIIQNLYLFRLNGLVHGSIPNIIWSAWSLGTEVQFYAVTPILLVMPFPVVAAVTMASLGFQVYSYYHYLPDLAGYWSYRTSCGTLYIYCMGISFARRADNRYAALLGSVIALQVSLMLLVYPIFRPFTVPSIMEVFLGTIAVVPIVNFAITFKHGGWDKWDRRIGNLSYPIFLTHILGMYVADIVISEKNTSKEWVLLAMISCFILSIIMYWLVEIPADKMRYWIRGFRGMQSVAQSAR
jgi:peptidoglycan/LPS O-acetylase OafA/YrhL